jgi:uncharacterized protein DUF1501
LNGNKPKKVNRDRTANLANAGRWLLNRRDFLRVGGTGLGAVALTALLAEQGLLAGDKSPIQPQWSPENPSAPRPPHFPAKAKNVLVIFCSGALSHLDVWDYKPELVKRDGQALPESSKLVTFQGENGALAKPLWEFKPRGKSGKMISNMLPRLAELADDLCFIHSMTANSNTHGPAENQMSTGFTLEGFPSAGAWVSYALGTENQNLPAFVAIPDPRGVPQVGPNHWNCGFLPAAFQGTAFNTDNPIPNLRAPSRISDSADMASRDFLKFLNDKHMAQHPGDNQLSARIASYELAAKMQISAAEVTNFSGETAATLQLYGVDGSNQLKSRFAKNCLLARRLVERGVRFVQLFNGAYAMGEGVGNWDGHKTLKKQYDIHAPILDQPCAALIADLKQRGLLESTLVAFVTEFGRMPTFQKDASGRDHNPHGFTVWLTGAGVKHGFSYGATDEFGYKAVDDVATIYDLHATMLHLLGLDHERLTFYHNGTERRLTDVHGEVLKGVLA